MSDSVPGVLRRSFLAESEGTRAPLPPPDRSTVTMPRRPLGTTGERVARVGLGGYPIGSPKWLEPASL
jgi:hypothetical protein